MLHEKRRTVEVDDVDISFVLRENIVKVKSFNSSGDVTRKRGMVGDDENRIKKKVFLFFFNCILNERTRNLLKNKTKEI